MRMLFIMDQKLKQQSINSTYSYLIAGTSLPSGEIFDDYLLMMGLDWNSPMLKNAAVMSLRGNSDVGTRIGWLLPLIPIISNFTKSLINSLGSLKGNAFASDLNNATPDTLAMMSMVTKTTLMCQLFRNLVYSLIEITVEKYEILSIELDKYFYDRLVKSLSDPQNYIELAMAQTMSVITREMNENHVALVNPPDYDLSDHIDKLGNYVFSLDSFLDMVTEYGFFEFNKDHTVFNKSLVELFYATLEGPDMVVCFMTSTFDASIDGNPPDLSLYDNAYITGKWFDIFRQSIFVPSLTLQ